MFVASPIIVLCRPDSEDLSVVCLFAGATATTCGQIVAYPLQLIRTRLQAQGMKGRFVAELWVERA